MISRWLLSALSREVAVADGSTPSDDPLKILRWAYPDLEELISGKSVLDFGCGFGEQAAAIAQRYGAKVTGLDTNERYLAEARRRYGHVVRFVSSVKSEEGWDVVLSLDAMEHFSDPWQALQDMRSVARPGALILLSFGPPWWAPYGTHMDFFCRIPWLQLWFSEKTVMAVRAKFRKDGATRYEEVEAGLNRMSLRKFERLIERSGLAVRRLRYHGVKRMDWITRVPFLREFGTSHVTAILERNLAGHS